MFAHAYTSRKGSLRANPAGTESGDFYGEPQWPADHRNFDLDQQTGLHDGGDLLVARRRLRLPAAWLRVCRQHADRRAAGLQWLANAGPTAADPRADGANGPQAGRTPARSA